MSSAKSQFKYREIGAEELESVRRMWEKLNCHHAALSPLFSARRLARTFEARKQEFGTKAAAGKLRIELVFHAGDEAAIAYCITSLASGIGEIDSLFIEEEFRGRGVGTELMHRALQWLDAQGAVSKVVVVAHGNDSAINFYSRFGFCPDNVILRQIA